MHSIWLIPSEGSSAQICNTIARISSQLGRPAFQPHITMLGDLDCAPGALIEKTSNAIANLESCQAQVAGIDGSDSYFMSLYLDISIPCAFENARRDLAQSINLQTLGQFRPHVSLAYGSIEEERKRDLISKIASEFDSYEFELTAIEVVASGNMIPVEKWRSIWRRDLVSPLYRKEAV